MEWQPYRLESSRRGGVTGAQLPCVKCKGAGVATIKRTDGGK